MRDDLEFWDPAPFVQAAHILVAADEPLRALNLLNNLPGYYRDHEPPVIKYLKKEILKLIATPGMYAGSDKDVFLFDLEKYREQINNVLRWILIRNDVIELNKEGYTPHVVDYGPGEYWLPIMLDACDLKFTYQDISLHKAMKDLFLSHKASSHLSTIPEDQPQIYVACEIIEHLHYENEIIMEMLRAGCEPKIVHVSTPKYTFDWRRERLDWREHGDLGHLRTYTPKEFQDVIVDMFKDYAFQLYDSKILHMRGVRRGDSWETKSIPI